MRPSPPHSGSTMTAKAICEENIPNKTRRESPPTTTADMIIMMMAICTSLVRSNSKLVSCHHKSSSSSSSSRWRWLPVWILWSQVILLLTSSGSTIVHGASTSALGRGMGVVVSTADLSTSLSTGLSRVVADLGASGCTDIATTCLIMSRGVARRDRIMVLEALLGTSGTTKQQGNINPSVVGVSGGASAVAATEDPTINSDDTSNAIADDSTMASSQQERRIVGEQAIRSKVIGLSSGLVLSVPNSLREVVSAVCASCGDGILYYPDPVDLSRGEGLFDALAPVMEVLLAQKQAASLIEKNDAMTTPQKNILYVLVLDGNVEMVQAAFESAAESVLMSLNAPDGQSVAVLQDVFEKIVYTTPTDALQAMNKIPLMDAATHVGQALSSSASLLSRVGSSSETSKTTLSADNLAAARVLGPAARTCLTEAIDQIKKSCLDEQESNPSSWKLIPDFGALCDAAIQRAVDDFESVADENKVVLQSTVGRQIRQGLLSGLDAELGSIFEEQVNQLTMASFENFKRSLSKLLITPNLATDMEQEAKKSRGMFSSAAHKLIAKRYSSWSTEAARQLYGRMVQEHISNRLLAARASGQFRPVPRKGIQVGFHWLLPKPFGNDFRQEPWMVHATDSMVYIPKDKITDISPGEVVAGDWRNKIVPSPVGNDMLYMQ